MKESDLLDPEDINSVANVIVKTLDHRFRSQGLNVQVAITSTLLIAFRKLTEEYFAPKDRAGFIQHATRLLATLAEVP